MTTLYDFTSVHGNDLPYGGNAGLKKGFSWNGDNWFLKFPKSTRNFRNIEISYTTSPLSEYIGSQIYETIGIPVHSTRMGIYENKAVVACKDFLQAGERLYEFGELKNIYSAELDRYEEMSDSSGTNTDLNATLKIMETNPVLQSVSGVQERFWDMFIVDAFIGNNDRNNGNWGLIYTLDGEKRLSPVYDNGNCFRNKASDKQLQKTMSNEEAIKKSAYESVHSIYVSEKGNMVNPYEYIDAEENEECIAAVKRIVPKINIPRIKEMIQEIPETYHGVEIISSVKKEYYGLMLQKRYEDKLLPALERIQTKEKNLDPIKEMLDRVAEKTPQRERNREKER